MSVMNVGVFVVVVKLVKIHLKNNVLFLSVITF